jgi:hypothetical protein
MGCKGKKPKGSASKFFRPARLPSAAFLTPPGRIPRRRVAHDVPCAQPAVAAFAVHGTGAFMAAGLIR